KKPYLIHGVTGSGKTEVYMEIIEFALNQGLDSIFLVPEIALTPQTIDRLKSRFGDLVGVFHSKLSEGEKHDVYKAVKAGKVRVLIG
ncbi:DEAD/DEAH box helicase family protein, partial [Clostridioides difficile]|nr:DEAD/DEAH box helicase family protein [Clostridioides difficile]